MLIRTVPVHIHKPKLTLFIGVCLFGLLTVVRVSADNTETEQNTITLNLGDEIELKTLIDYVSLRLKINILYDEQIARKKITIKAPRKVTNESLRGLLESALKMKGLALVDAEEPGWKKVVAVSDLVPIAKPQGDEAAKPTQAVTRIFTLAHVNPKAADQIVKPFLSDKAANTLVVANSPILIVTDYASNMQRLADLIQLADRPGPKIEMRFIAARHVPASQLAQETSQLITSRKRLAAPVPGSGGGGASGSTGADKVDLTHNERTNQVIVLGTARAIEEAAAIIESLDVALDLETKIYQFTAASPERIDRITKELIGEQDAKRLYRSVVDREAHMLIVTTTPGIHAKVAKLRQDLDVPLAETQSPVRFYKLMHSKAADVLATIQRIEGGQRLADIDVTGIGGQGLPNTVVNQRNYDQYTPPANLRPDPAIEERGSVKATTSEDLRPVTETLQTERARVTADTNTNSIIVVADPETQRVYQRLIEMLDRRRPQVLLECVIVSLDTSGGYSLGVEVLRQGDVDDKGRYLVFSNFGLSEVDADAGSLTLTPGIGFNGSIISADIADIVIKALKSSGRTKVLSAPRLLINDNATGTLEAVNEAPVGDRTENNSGSNTFGFQGFVEAGTTVTLTPHIAEGDHLQLEYAISINSFGEGGGDGLAPPRSTNALQSEVTIPDGHTIIVGGLNRVDSTETIRRIPILGELPVIEYLFSDRSTTDSESSLFVFIRPIILRDDRFRDLKYLSSQDLERAELPADYPASDPIAMR